MKKLGYVLAGFAGGIVFLVLVGAALVSNPVFVVDESKYDYDETVEKLEVLSKEHGWTVSHMYNLQATMQKNGFAVEPVMVFSICKPQIAYDILSSDNERPASVMMPCRVSVYRTKDGKTYLSRMNAGMMASMLTGVSKDAMTRASLESEKFIDLIIKK
jgi:uncharacterized protein (DUF302 family)